jgi:RNA polymerase sigma factor (sigma-70 family)
MPRQRGFSDVSDKKEKTEKYYRNSYTNIDPEITKLVRYEAGKAIGKTGFRKHDQEDIEQELMIAAIKALKKYDPSKGTKEVLLRSVIRNTLNSIYRYRQAQMRDWRKVESLNVLVEDPEETYEAVDLVTDKGYFGGFDIEAMSPNDGINLKMDIDSIIEKLPEKLRELCNDMKYMTVLEAAAKRKISKDTVYRQLKKIRQFMEESGFLKL